MGLPITMRRKAEQAMTLRRHKAGVVPALDTITINRYASLASRLIVMAQPQPLIAGADRGTVSDRFLWH